MSKSLALSLKLSVVGLLIWLAPQNVSAAELYFKVVPNTSGNDRATIVEARVDPQGKKLNVVEGIVNFQGDIVDKLSVAVETGGSVLTMWPTSPVYSTSDHAIRFAGGVPAGFTAESLLFRLRLFSSVTGNTTISWIGGTVYLNDGQGTKEPVSARSLSINLNEEVPQAISKTSPDTTPPTFDSVDVGQDPSVHDGKYFISFHATDDTSGIARYEIKEGDNATSVTDGVYVFKDQNRSTPVTIIAYDQAGNSQEIKIPVRYDWRKNVIIISLAIIVLLVVIIYVYKKKIKK